MDEHVGSFQCFASDSYVVNYLIYTSLRALGSVPKEELLG